jgi:hypothetical protein
VVRMAKTGGKWTIKCSAKTFVEGSLRSRRSWLGDARDAITSILSSCPTLPSTGMMAVAKESRGTKTGEPTLTSAILISALKSCAAEEQNSAHY